MQASEMLLDPMDPVRRPRVVVVDDNEVFRRGLRELLEDYDIEVLGEGADGAAAIDLVERLLPDIVLMDLRMPGVDGIEAARTIKAGFPETQVIMLTAYDDQALREDAMEASVSKYLIKGARPESIHRAVVDAFGAAMPRPSRPDPRTGEDPLQRLAAAQIRLFSLRRRVTDPGHLDVLDELGQAVEIGMEGLRELMFEIRPPAMERSALGAALRAQLLRDEQGGQIELDMQDSLSRELAESVWATAFDIGREAVENVRRHAGASRVRMTLGQERDGLLVEIADDGRGLSPRDLTEGGIGLPAMRDRAEAAGGWCRIWSLPGAGTTVKYWLPM
jgi:DNA-binding NarL/FixJ family response regulator